MNDEWGSDEARASEGIGFERFPVRCRGQAGDPRVSNDADPERRDGVTEKRDHVAEQVGVDRLLGSSLVQLSCGHGWVRAWAGPSGD